MICFTVLHSLLHVFPHERQLVNVDCLLVVCERIDIRHEFHSGNVRLVLDECVVSVTQTGENRKEIHSGIVGHFVVHLQMLKT